MVKIGMPAETVVTPLTKLLNIRVPIILAGMNGVSHSELAAAVSNAGGLGVIGSMKLTPKALKKEIDSMKQLMVDPSLPFGVDLALPQVGGGARKTNTDYTEGKLSELVDVMIAEGCSLFVSAVGVPPDWVVERLHKAGVLCANMVGSPRHAEKALAAGMDVIIAQGMEGGGHTGEIGTIVLIREVIETCRGHLSRLTGQPVAVVGAGGIADGAAMAAAIMLGAQAVWVGTRFVNATESAANSRHKQTVIECGAHDTVKTIIVTGRPLRAFNSDYVKAWEAQPEKIKELCDKGIAPFYWDMENSGKDGRPVFSFAKNVPMLMGQVAAIIKDVKPAAEIMRDMTDECVRTMRHGAALLGPTPPAPSPRARL